MSVFRVISNLFRFNRTNWKAVTLCFFAALVFWLFSSLNKTHTSNINFPLEFVYDANRYVPVSLPDQVNLNVSGNGWELLRKSIGYRLPVLSISLDKPIEVKKIPGSTLLPLVSGQLGSLQINYLVGDTLSLQIDLKDSHKFKLVADLSKISYKEGFGRISPIVILPDSVEVTGPKSVLHNFPDTVVLTLSENKLNQNFREELEVVVPNDELVKRDPPVAEVRFEVGEVETLPWKLKLQVLNKNARAKAVAPDSVLFYLIVPKNQGRNILTQTQATAVVDISLLSKGKSIVLPKAEGLSPIVHVLRSDSIQVEVY